ncbi:bacteriocin immunity protein [Acerihabitans sp. TG2]|uniref:bacteriocin immunity protein n=1 Tax=Acerihabitans sp. TG2 TaxID=3096008 RepID=UPI002B2382CD|nr:bacteriocin immunity protein [Acerihabitans sp. TG2]MEA9393617.1 bacteriocin immunity protein [Acerihabitans sp. TG2]
MKFLNRFEDYTEQEFREFLNEFHVRESTLSGDTLASYIDKLVNHFEAITEHPLGSDLIYYPNREQGDGIDGIINEVIKWRAMNGKPGFKRP